MLKLQKAAGEIAGIDNPFYRLHDGRAAETTSVEGKEVVNFSSYDYLGLNTHPDVGAAAKAAIDKFGTSVGAACPTTSAGAVAPAVALAAKTERETRKAAKRSEAARRGAAIAAED